MFKSRTLTIAIQRDLRTVYEFVSDGANLPRWATAFCKSAKPSKDGWLVETPQGLVTIRLAARNALGVDDLLFRSRLETVAARLGTPLTIAADASAALRPGSGVSRVLIDVNLSRGDALMMTRNLRAAHAEMPVIGYYSHVQHDLRQHALQAGCTKGLPRSAFVQRLPELLSRGFSRSTLGIPARDGAGAAEEAQRL